MNQTRTFLLIAWMMVATLLWMQYSREQAAPAAPVTAATVSADASVPTAAAVPSAPASAPSDASVPNAPVMQATPGMQAVSEDSASTAARAVTVTSDVLRLVIDGGNVRQAELLQYAKDPKQPERVVLFNDNPAQFFEAQSGWVSNSGSAPTHSAGFVPEGATDVALAEGIDSVQVPFVWQGENGISIRRIYTVQRGQYVINVRDEVINQGSAPWSGFVYRQLNRVPPPVKRGFTNPESYSFHGAAWYSNTDKFEKRKFADFADKSLSKESTGGWIAMLQHHFFAAWIPQAEDVSTFSLATTQGAGGTQYLIRELGPGLNVAPGTQAATEARLWVGPKLVGQINAQNVQGLDRAVDFSSYSIMAALGGALFWVLNAIHGVVGNWGWAIIGLVIVIKLLMYPLSAAQYRSMAKMRKFQPRIEQLKERYGDDKQKFQQAMMELYKKEKINPVGGCLPILLQMPVFLALYWVLLEAVELRHAPWIGWITNLTAPDPWFILPVLNIAVMWATQKLSPMPGVDPMQKRIMQFMPVAFGVMMVFFPAGLVLYWVTNGALGLLQQWWMMKRYGDKPGTAGAKKGSAEK